MGSTRRGHEVGRDDRRCQAGWHGEEGPAVRESGRDRRRRQAAQQADGLDTGGSAADQAGEFEVQEGGVQGGGWQGGGGGEAAMAQELAVDQRRQDRPGGGIEARPGLGARATTVSGGARACDGGAGHGGAEFLEDVGEAADQGRTVADELVAAGGAGVPGSSREHEHVAHAAAAGGSGR
jgi:hypothetical protein